MQQAGAEPWVHKDKVDSVRSWGGRDHQFLLQHRMSRLGFPSLIWIVFLSWTVRNFFSHQFLESMSFWKGCNFYHKIEINIMNAFAHCITTAYCITTAT